MTAATFSPTASLGSKLAAIRSRVIAGSVHPAIRARAAEALRAVGGDDAWAAFARLYDDLRASGVRLPDPGHDAGYDRIEPASVTLEKMAGDCDDWTVAVLALARALGFRGDAVTLSVEEAGGLSPLHVYPAVHRTQGVTVAADASEGLALGDDPAPRFGPHVVRESWEMEPAGSAVGFLGAIATAVSGFFAAKEGRKAARDQRAAAEASASAAVEVAERNKQAAQLDAQVTREAIAAKREETTIGAFLQKREQDLASRQMTDVLTFMRDMAPAGVALVALSVLAPLAQQLVGGK